MICTALYTFTISIIIFNIFINICTIFYLFYEFGLNIIHEDVTIQAKIMLLNSSVILHVLPIAVFLDQNRQFFQLQEWCKL